MSRLSYRVISCEGGDQCGKGDAILTFRKKFLERGVSITFSSFPLYASPFGTCIRKFLNNGMDDFDFSSRKGLKIKMALYALNRLELLDVLLANPEYKKTLILFDRSSFSNAVTLAYGIVNIRDLTNEEIDKFVKYAFWLDGLMIRKLKLRNCIVQMIALNSSWENLRSGGQRDIYENPDVQAMTEKTYDLFQGKVGDGWKKIITKIDKSWSDREEIFNSIYDFAVKRLGEFNLEVFPKGYNANIREIICNSYSGTKVKESDVDGYLKALEENNKDSMYIYSIKVGEQIGKSCSSFLLNDKDVRKKFCMIFKDLPELYMVLEQYLGSKFKEVVSESIYEWTLEE